MRLQKGYPRLQSTFILGSQADPLAERFGRQIVWISEHAGYDFKNMGDL